MNAVNVVVLLLILLVASGAARLMCSLPFVYHLGLAPKNGEILITTCYKLFVENLS
jgi:hypothetical protein